jgi:death on curing protein
MLSKWPSMAETAGSTTRACWIALWRPVNFASYGEPAVADLAAAYAFGVARNHPFVDGKKRTAAVVSETFLVLNGYELTATDAELVVAFVALADGELSEVEMADWFRQRIQ